MNEWKLEVATLDYGWEWGIAISIQSEDNKRIKGHAVHFQKHATNDVVANNLRALADLVEQKMGPLNER